MTKVHSNPQTIMCNNDECLNRFTGPISIFRLVATALSLLLLLAIGAMGVMGAMGAMGSMAAMAAMAAMRHVGCHRPSIL